MKLKKKNKKKGRVEAQKQFQWTMGGCQYFLDTFKQLVEQIERKTSQEREFSELTVDTWNFPEPNFTMLSSDSVQLNFVSSCGKIPAIGLIL